MVKLFYFSTKSVGNSILEKQRNRKMSSSCFSTFSKTNFAVVYVTNQHRFLLRSSRNFTVQLSSFCWQPWTFSWSCCSVVVRCNRCQFIVRVWCRSFASRRFAFNISERRNGKSVPQLFNSHPSWRCLIEIFFFSSQRLTPFFSLTFSFI